MEHFSKQELIGRWNSKPIGLNKAMELENLTIDLKRYGPHQGRYLAKVKYCNNEGGIILNLSPELSEDLLRFTGKAIKKYSEDAAKELQDSINLSVEKAQKRAVLRAQDIREGSWDGMRKYNKTDGESACEAVKEFALDAVWSCVISGWLSFMWNDCQSWAEEIISR